MYYLEHEGARRLLTPRPSPPARPPGIDGVAHRGMLDPCAARIHPDARRRAPSDIRVVGGRPLLVLRLILEPERAD